jgi:hypothetical protein
MKYGVKAPNEFLKSLTDLTEKLSSKKGAEWHSRLLRFLKGEQFSKSSEKGKRFAPIRIFSNDSVTVAFITAVHLDDGHDSVHIRLKEFPYNRLRDKKKAG